MKYVFFYLRKKQFLLGHIIFGSKPLAWGFDTDIEYNLPAEIYGFYPF